MGIGDVPLTPIIDPVTGAVTEIGRIFLRTLTAAVGALAPIDAAYWTSRAESVLSAEVNLGALASGYLKLASAVGIATPTTVPTIPQADVTGLTAALASKATLPIAQADVTGLTADLATKAPLVSPALTGLPTAPTAAAATNTTQLATTAMVQAALAPSVAGLAGKANLAGGNAFTGPQAIAGAVTVSALGPHVWSASGATWMDLQLRNTAPSGFGAQVQLGTDVTGGATILQSLSSTFPGSGDTAPNTSRLYAAGSGGLALVAGAAASIRLSTNNVQRLAIAATGEVAINGTNPAAARLFVGVDPTVNAYAFMIQNTNGAVNQNFIAFMNSAFGLAGSIGQTSGTTVAYNTTSDARLKNDDGRASDLSALRGVVVHDFTWKADGIRDRGIFAQEAHALYPRAVSPGTDDRTDRGDLTRPWMTDYSKFVADLIVGWQTHEATIADLRAELAALRARLEEG